MSHREGQGPCAQAPWEATTSPVPEGTRGQAGVIRVGCSPAGNTASREGRGGGETPDLSPTALQPRGGSSLWTNPPGRSRAGSPGGAVHRISSWGHGMGWRGLQVGQEVRRENAEHKTVGCDPALLDLKGQGLKDVSPL